MKVFLTTFCLTCLVAETFLLVTDKASGEKLAVPVGFFLVLAVLTLNTIDHKEHH